MSETALQDLRLSGSFRVGRTLVTHLSDGVVVEPRASWFHGVDPACWMPVVGVDSPDTPFPVTFGGFLVQTPDATTMFDCGLGPRARSMSPGIREGGNLLHRLEEAGVAPGEVDRVVISHLHVDHCGHLLKPDGSLTFESAEVWLHHRELEYWQSGAAAENIQPALIQRYLEALESASVLRTYADEFELSPGIRLIPSPGHTPGHTAMLLSSAGAHAMLLGDVVHHTAHFTHPQWLQSYDVAPESSFTTRRELFDRAARLGAVVTAVHMPILTLGTVATTESGGHVYHPARP
ncbi:MBL fold metallo-hydrolase [Amycolatopsis silviterrae]|uniref:MBL fold metallo-hydrolase n=1 Tax=Amycolatopsis silviterrae TaxID=1656914 RepID=A0ABW5H3V8_9PSEU